MNTSSKRKIISTKSGDGRKFCKRILTPLRLIRKDTEQAKEQHNRGLAPHGHIIRKEPM